MYAAALRRLNKRLSLAHEGIVRTTKGMVSSGLPVVFNPIVNMA